MDADNILNNIVDNIVNEFKNSIGKLENRKVIKYY